MLLLAYIGGALMGPADVRWKEYNLCIEYYVFCLSLILFYFL